MLTFVLIAEGDSVLLGFYHEMVMAVERMKLPVKQGAAPRRWMQQLAAPFLPKFQQMSIPVQDSTKHLT